MIKVNLTDAKARLGELVAQAAADAFVCIMRRGRPVAQLTAIEKQRQPIALDDLRALTDSMPKEIEVSLDLVRRMRDESRY